MSQVTTLEYNGLIAGDVNSGYGISRLEGFGAPLANTSSEPKTGGDGTNIFAQNYSSRIMQFRIETMGNNVDQYLQRARALIKAWSINKDADLIVGLWNGEKRRINARVTSGPAPIYEPDNITVNDFRVEFEAENPYFLENAAQSFSVGLPVKGGFPVAGPLPFPLGARTGGKFTINNSGDATSYARFVINGPVVNPEVRNATTGKAFRISTTIPDGSYVEVYRKQQGVFAFLNGNQNYRSFLKGEFFPIIEGNNLIKWNATTFEADASLEASFYNPYLSV